MTEVDPKYVDKLEKLIDIFDYLVDKNGLKNLSDLITRVEMLEIKIRDLEKRIFCEDSFIDVPIEERLKNLEIFIGFLSKLSKDSVNGDIQHNNNGSGYFTYNLNNY